MRRPLTLTLLILWAVVAQADHFQVTPIPEWVKPIEPPTDSKVSKYDVIGGAFASLVDQQINLKLQADFTHIVYDVVSNAGVENVSEIVIPYDSAYQTVDFHYLRVWRDGEMIDRTEELTFEFLRNEMQLEMSIYTGMVTAYDVLEDIRKGDRIEYAYTIIGDNPIFGDKNFRFLVLDHGNPVDHMFVRVMWDEKSNYTTKCHSCDSIKVSEYADGTMKVAEMERFNITPYDFEDGTPVWHFPYAYFTLTNFSSWSDVSSWAESVFHLETEPNLDAIVKDVQRGRPQLEDQIDAAINYVQDEIRYMGMENGIGSIKPFAPDQVLKQRYGDCKDKSLLLVSILKKLGLSTAYPALVSSAMMRGVEKMLPAGQVFDHCIVHFNHDGNDYWIDPSQPYQAGKFSSLCIPDYGRALVVGLHSDHLKDMKILDKTTRTEVKEEFFFTSIEEPCTLKVESKYFGLMADYMRGSLEYISRKELADQYRESYGRMFPNIETVGTVEIKDDEKNNELYTSETYVISRAWKPFSERAFKGSRLRYEPLELYNYIGQTECEKKKHPVQLPFPASFMQTTTIHLPKPLEIKDEEVLADNAGFTYLNTIDAVSDTLLQLGYVFTTKTDEITAEEFDQVCYDMNDIASKIAYIITYSELDLNSDAFKKFMNDGDKKSKKKKK